MVSNRVAGVVDAGFGTVDVYFEQEKYGVHVLEDGELWKELPDFTNQAMVTSDKAIAEKRDMIVKVMAAYAKLFRFINTPGSKEAWIKARAIALGKDEPKEAETQWSFFNKPGILATNLVLTEKQFEDDAFAFDFRRRVGLVFQNPDVQLFNPTVFDEVAFGPLQLRWPN